MKLKSLKGVQDILPPETSLWQHIEDTAREIFKKYGYREIRLPILEATEVFIRSIGETTDIVEKEMYTFRDKGNRSVTLRPEGTAPFVRAYIQHHLYNEPSPQKYFYMGPMYRYERPQAFRYRQFYQIGAEALGTEDPKLDSEVIIVLMKILKKAGLSELNTELTSIGCKDCRPDYRKALQKAFKINLDAFCEDCQRRFDINPLRILDCKVPSCIEYRKQAPAILDFLCGTCKQHLEAVMYHLKLLAIPYTINSTLVRGLDYYTRTTFEITSESLGSQKAVAAGGRYDRLVKEFGGPPTPGIGFAIGMERIIPLIKESAVTTEHPDVFFCTVGKEASEKGFILGEQLRERGLSVALNYEEASLKSQMRKADRMNVRNVIVIGDDELRQGKAVIRNMHEKRETRIALETEDIVQALGVKSS
jgi:histidyl-tRNA synthetase